MAGNGFPILKISRMNMNNNAKALIVSQTNKFVTYLC